MNKHNCKPDCHINIVYCGGCCVSRYREYNQTVKLFESDYSKNYMIVSSSDWTDYNDTTTYQGSKYYCMISDGCVINLPKPDSLDQ